MEEQLQQAVDELKALRAQVQQGQTAEAQAQARADQTQRTSANLIALDQQLALGDTSIGPTLDSLYPSLGPVARLGLDNAKAALANNDLANARVYLRQAAVDAAQGR